MNLYELYRSNPVISTDTRKITSGSLFFALKGNNFDANLFAEEALRKGAAYAVVDDPSVVKDKRYVLVSDVLESLQKLAGEHRKNLNCPVIVIAGSNGKTTTKELLNKVLGIKYRAFATQGNLNNHIGVPITLLSIPKDTEFAIIEIGANHVGENRFLCGIATPDFGIVTNCGKDHLEGFGGINGVIQSNREVYDFLKESNGKCFINADDPLLMEMAEGIGKISYGREHSSADIRGSLREKFPFIKVNVGGTDISSRLFGSFQLYNILCAVAAGSYFGVEMTLIKAAIEDYIPSNNRSQLIKWKNNTVLLDAYNANPSSMTEIVRDFGEMPHSHKVMILGDMFELGEESEKEHRAIVELVEKSGIREVILVGEMFSREASGKKATCFLKTDEAKEYVLNLNLNGAFILAKGSRGMALEKIFG
jgi:UDP-N-acetylmuramoyl-tripeptide--D-alanyl-D-alanine ligase